MMDPTVTNFRAIFPDLPRPAKMVDENGFIDPLWSLGLASLFQALQNNFKSEGILFPVLTGTQIAEIQSLYTPLIGAPLPVGVPDISGQTVFDYTNKVSRQFVIIYDTSNPPNILIAQWMTFAFTPLTPAQITTIANIYTPYIGMPFPAGLPNFSGFTAFDTTNNVSKQFIITYDSSVPPNILTASWSTFQFV